MKRILTAALLVAAISPVFGQPARAGAAARMAPHRSTPPGVATGAARW